MCKKPGREYGKKNMTEARKAAGYIVLSLSLFPLLRQLAVCRSATVPTVGGGEGGAGGIGDYWQGVCQSVHARPGRLNNNAVERTAGRY